MELIKEKTLMKDVEKMGEVVTIIPDNLWVVQNVGKEGADELQFVTFSSSDMDGSDLIITVDPLFLIQGYSEVLREGRHTFFPDKGYIFYMNRKHMIAALDYCTLYFDMN